MFERSGDSILNLNIEEVVLNKKPIDMLGAIGLVQLEKFDDIHLRRRSNKQRLTKIFSRIKGKGNSQEHLFMVVLFLFNPKCIFNLTPIAFLIGRPIMIHQWHY